MDYRKCGVIGRRRRMRPASTDDRRGISLVWITVVLTVLIGFSGFGIDVGWMVWTGQQLQVAADASALAGARWVRDDLEQTRDAAQAVGAANTAAGDAIQLDRNGGNAEDGDITIGRFDRDTGEFTATEDDPNAVRVLARRTEDSLNDSLDLHFMRLLGFNTANITREAIAMIGGGTGAGLLVLNESEDCSFRMQGSITLELNGGAVQINSENNCAGCFVGRAAEVGEGSVLNAVGDVCGFSPVPVNPDSEPIPDPLAFLPEPPIGPTQPDVDQSGNVTISPGYYPNGISRNGGTLTMLPGIYNIGGPGLDVQGNANLIAEGVLIHTVDNAALDFRGTGDLTITPMESGIYEGMSVFQSRSNTAANVIIGTAGWDLTGTFYIPEGHLQTGGDGLLLGNQLIVNTIEVFGNGSVIVAYDGRNPAPGNSVFLVR